MADGFRIVPSQRRTVFTKVIQDYEDVPREYRDQQGLPFKKDADLNKQEVDAIFGGELEVREANQLLRILHGRRVAGTLDDPAFAIHTAGFTEKQQTRALAYLRKIIRVNEVYNAGLRAEDELNQMDEAENEAESKASQEAESKKRGITDKDGEDTKPVGPYKADSVYGNSKFDIIRHANQIKNRNKELQRKEAQKEMEEEERKLIRSGKLTIAEDGTRLPTNPKVREYYVQAQSEIKEVPQMSPWTRVAPSAFITVLALAFLAALSTVYEEPADKYRLLREISPAWATVGTIIVTSLAVQLMWRIPPLWRFLNHHFMLVVGMPRPSSLFGAIFSHQNLKHFLPNMIPLWFIGTRLHDDIGRADFLLLYLASGSLGFLTSLVTYTSRGMLGVSTQGASGAMLGVATAYFWSHRDDRFKIFGLPDSGIHGVIFLALLVASQVGAAGMMLTRYRIDVASHIGGMVVGWLGIELINWARGRKEEKKVFELVYGPNASQHSWNQEGTGGVERDATGEKNTRH